MTDWLRDVCAMKFWLGVIMLGTATAIILGMMAWAIGLLPMTVAVVFGTIMTALISVGIGWMVDGS